MPKMIKTFNRCLWGGLLVLFILGCGGGTSSTSSGGISRDKYSREASDRFPDPFLGQQKAPMESTPPSTITPDKAARDSSDRFPDPFLGKGR
jgi:hypothetical protein